jgi:hypothetical protein
VALTVCGVVICRVRRGYDSVRRGYAGCGVAMKGAGRDYAGCGVAMQGAAWLCRVRRGYAECGVAK